MAGNNGVDPAASLAQQSAGDRIRPAPSVP